MGDLTTYMAFWRTKNQARASFTEGWVRAPGVYPAGSEDPTDDLETIAASFSRRIGVRWEGVDAIEFVVVPEREVRRIVMEKYNDYRRADG